MHFFVPHIHLQSCPDCFQPKEKTLVLLSEPTKCGNIKINRADKHILSSLSPIQDSSSHKLEKPTLQRKTNAKMKYLTILLTLVALFACMAAAGFKDPNQADNMLYVSLPLTTTQLIPLSNNIP
jgi:hypothetical protein